MSEELKRKVLKLAAQILWMHGETAGDRVCQDWSGDTEILDSFTDAEKDVLSFQYQKFNSNGNDFEAGYFPYDEMMISFIIARALDKILEELR